MSAERPKRPSRLSCEMTLSVEAFRTFIERVYDLLGRGGGRGDAEDER